MALKVFRYFFRAMTGAYTLGLLLFFLGHYLIGERWFVVAFLNSFAHLFILPSLLLLPICLLIRHWRLSAALLPSILFFAFTWGSFFLPDNSVQAQTNDIALRSLSYNIGAKGQDPQMVVDLIRSVDADIVALQELGDQHVAPIESQLSEIYPYMALHPSPYTAGQGILSRYPLSEDSYWQYDFLAAKLGHQRIVIYLGEGIELTIYNLHPSHPGMNSNFFNSTYRSRELADILGRSTAEEGRVILMGDFNMTDLTDDYGAIHSHYKDAFRESGMGFGWTFTISDSPAFLRLDYLFYSAGIRALSAEVWATKGGSDHYPLVVELLVSRP